MTPRKPKVHKRIMGMVYNAYCGTQSKSDQKLHFGSRKVIDCKRCLKLMNTQTQGKRG